MSPCDRANSSVKADQPTFWPAPTSSSRRLDGERPSKRSGPLAGSTLYTSIQAMDEAGIPYCILHRYETFPEEIPSDVDCVVPSEFISTILPQALAQHGLHIVQDVHHGHEPDGHLYVLVHDLCRTDTLLKLDVISHWAYNGRLFYSADQLLKSRRKYKQFWVLTPNLEFICYLLKKVTRASLDAGQQRYLTELYRRDPSGCRQEVERWWGRDSARCLVHAAETGEWSLVKRRLPSVRSELLRLGVLRHPIGVFSFWLGEIKRRLLRWFYPTGLVVAILGPDGAGKSTVIREVRTALGPAFFWTRISHFPPRPVRLFQGRPVTDPHRLPPWPLPIAVLKIMYWLVAITLYYSLRLRPQLVRATLVLYDRYLPDILVDPLRYRYGGPLWLARLVWLLAPQPETVVILLDVRTETIRMRKREAPFEEIVRQRNAYRALMKDLANGVILDASRPIETVAADVTRAVLEHLAARTAKRLNLDLRR